MGSVFGNRDTDFAAVDPYPGSMRSLNLAVPERHHPLPSLALLGTPAPSKI